MIYHFPAEYKKEEIKVTLKALEILIGMIDQDDFIARVELSHIESRLVEIKQDILKERSPERQQEYYEKMDAHFRSDDDDSAIGVRRRSLDIGEESA
jgi:hypothetical protein